MSGLPLRPDQHRDDGDREALDPGAADSLAAIIAGLGDLLERRPDLRPAVRRLAAWLGRVAERGIEHEITPTPAADVPPAPAAPLPMQQQVLRLAGAEALVEVATPAASVAPADRPPLIRGPEIVPPPPAPEPSLPLILQRARLKAEACRWAITRRRRMQDKADFDTIIKPTDADLARRARQLPVCFLWPLNPYQTLPDDETLEDMAACYDNLAMAIELTAEVLAAGDEGDDFREDIYVRLAEAQSAVRKGLLDHGVRPDQDQVDTFDWLRQRTREEMIFIPRFMKLSDPAEPGDWDDLSRRIADLRRTFESQRRERHERQGLLAKARHHLRQLRNPDPAEAMHHWNRLMFALDALVGLGVAASDPEVRDLVMPVADAIPDGLEMPGGFARIMQEIDRYVASREAEEPPEPVARALAPEVEQAARLLRGRSVVMIGGQARPQSRAALERAFGLRELNWITSEPHQSLEGFEPAIARPETAMVILAIRWSSHSFEGVKALCERYQKPYVRLPGGYNPNQVAAQIMQQASGQLGPRR
jgi:hypothetical protein